jgi:hypothetical protein
MYASKSLEGGKHSKSPVRAPVRVHYREGQFRNSEPSLRTQSQPRSRINQPEKKPTAANHYQHKGMLGVKAGSHAKADPTSRSARCAFHCQKPGKPEMADKNPKGRGNRGQGTSIQEAIHYLQETHPTMKDKPRPLTASHHNEGSLRKQQESHPRL